MAMDADHIKQLIEDGIPGAIVEITDLAGDGDHYSVRVTSREFHHKPLVSQHQLVYSALGDRMGEALHALQIHTVIPDEE